MDRCVRRPGQIDRPTGRRIGQLAEDQDAWLGDDDALSSRAALAACRAGRWPQRPALALLRCRRGVVVAAARSGAGAHSMPVRLAGSNAVAGPSHNHARCGRHGDHRGFQRGWRRRCFDGVGPAAGQGPAFALGGTIQRDGDTIRVITRMTNERSGATLWSDNFNYAGEAPDVPRHDAVDAGNVVRCGLFGASTYASRCPTMSSRITAILSGILGSRYGRAAKRSFRPSASSPQCPISRGDGRPLPAPTGKSQ